MKPPSLIARLNMWIDSLLLGRKNIETRERQRDRSDVQRKKLEQAVSDVEKTCSTIYAEQTMECEMEPAANGED